MVWKVLALFHHDVVLYVWLNLKGFCFSLLLKAHGIFVKVMNFKGKKKRLRVLKTHWSCLLEDCRTVQASIKTKLPYVWLSKGKGFSCLIINRLADFCNRTKEEAVRFHEIQLMTLLGLHEDLVGWRWKIIRSVQIPWVGWTHVSLGSQSYSWCVMLAWMSWGCSLVWVRGHCYWAIP